jgi:uncharacterized protein YecE (DUF72 family)
MTAASGIWIGPAGWSYDDWYGVVYPAARSSRFRPLAFIGRYFNAVEVNSSFYRIPTPRTTASWPRQVPAEFRFTFKLLRDFTHEREEFPSRALVDAFQAALEPIREAGVLGPVLIQFPWSFRFTPPAVERLRRLAETFPDFERVVEVRHRSWTAPEALEAVREVGGICNIDQPVLRDCIGPSEHVLGRTGYVRLHGRNAANWFRENIKPFERYNYLYTTDALKEWAERIEAMRHHAEQVYVFANNHYRGQGPANALELRAMIEGRKVDVPEDMLRAFPQLGAVANPPVQPGLYDGLGPSPGS